MNCHPCEFHDPYVSVYCSDCCPTVVIRVKATDSEGREVL